MNKLRLIARREYARCTGTKGFRLSTFGLPLAIVVVVTAVILLSGRGVESAGYVDQAGVIHDVGMTVTKADGTKVGPDPGKVHFRSFADIASGQAALSRKEIVVLYVLPADYLSTGSVQAFYWTRPPSNAVQAQFRSAVQANIVAAQPADVQARLIEGPKDMVVRSADGRHSTSGDGFGGVVIPGILAFFFSFSLMASVGYLLQAVTEEKENRTMEVLATSVSSNQLILGKTLGIVAAVLTQFAVWVAAAAAALVIAARFFEPIQGLHVSGWLLLQAALWFVPSYVLAAGMVLSIGAAVADFQQGQQITGALSLLFLLPIFFIALLFQNPDSPLLVFLTIFPTTSLATIAFRWGATILPWWQLVTSWLVLALTASGVIALAPRIFRRGMLRYGKRLGLRAALQAARTKGV